MPIDRKEIEQLARLARIRLPEAEARQFGSQVEEILDYVAQLDELPLNDVAPTRQVLGDAPPLRSDAPSAPQTRPEAEQQEALRPAPDPDAGHFRIPGVLERS